MNRRDLIIGAGALPLVAPIWITAARASEDLVDFLFVQNAESDTGRPLGAHAPPA